MKKLSLEKQIQQFLSSKCRNLWLGDGVTKLYLRKSQRVLEGRSMRCLDLGTIEVTKETDHGKGHAKAAIALLQQLNPFEALFIENAIHPVLSDALKRWGWRETPIYPYCYYRLTRLSFDVYCQNEKTN